MFRHKNAFNVTFLSRMSPPTTGSYCKSCNTFISGSQALIPYYYHHILLHPTAIDSGLHQMMYHVLAWIGVCSALDAWWLKHWVEWFWLAGGQMAAMLALGRRKNNQEWKHIPPHSSLLLVFLAITYVTGYTVKRRQCHGVCSLGSPDCVKTKKKNTCCPWIKAKNGFSTDRTTRVASESCFTHQVGPVGVSCHEPRFLCNCVQCPRPRVKLTEHHRLLHYLHCNEEETRSAITPRTDARRDGSTSARHESRQPVNLHFMGCEGSSNSHKVNQQLCT